MIVTCLLAVIMMAGLFIMLLAGVVFIQDKKYFTSAPKEIQEVIQPRAERFHGQHALGWVLMLISVLLMAGSLFYAGADGIYQGFTYGQFFLRYAIIVLLLKAFDILFFDWFLLCHSNFYPHFFPECKDIVGPHLFGFNRRSHMIQIILFVALSAALSGICLLFGSGNSSSQISGPEDPEFITGGVTDNSDPSASKAITSKDIVEYEVSFYTYDRDDYDRQGVYTFRIERESDGKNILTAECKYYSHELEISDEDLSGLQDIIDRYELVKDNGTDRVTAGISPEYGPETLRVTYASGEKLFFRYNGDMDEAWILETKEYLEGIMKKAGLT